MLLCLEEALEYCPELGKLQKPGKNTADEAVSVFDFATRTSGLKAREALGLPYEKEIIDRKQRLLSHWSSGSAEAAENDFIILLIIQEPTYLFQ